MANLSQVVVCPSCAVDLPMDNDGCPNCGYEWPFGDAEDAPFRIPPLLELIQQDRRMDDVSTKFLLRVYCAGERAGMKEAKEEVALWG